MATMTITTEKGVNSRYPYVTNTHIIASASSVAGGYKIERFKFSIPNTHNNKPVINATLVNVVFNGNGYYTVLGGTSVEAYAAITSSAGSWSTSGATNPGTSAVTIANFKDRGTITFTTASSGIITPAFKKNTTNNTALTPGTYYLYLYTKSSSYNERYIDNSGAITLTLSFDYTSYTKCGAPTKIYVGRGEAGTQSFDYFTEGDTSKIYISWSGATAGTSNAIDGYIIHCTDSSGAVIGNYSTLKSPYVMTLPQGLARGKYIKIQITTKGKAGEDFYSSKSSVSGYARINTLPSAPNIYYNFTDDIGKVTGNTLSVVSSATDKIKFVTEQDGGTTRKACTPGSDTDTQSYSIYYQRDDGDYKKWTNYPNSLTFDLNAKGKTTKFKFYTHDGLEYSAQTEIIINRNSVPTFTAKATVKENELHQKYNEEGGYYSYTDSPKISISNKKSSFGSTSFTYTYKLFYNNKTYSFSSLTSATQYLKMTNEDKSYQIYVYADDGIDVSEPVIVESSYWKIPAVPEVITQNVSPESSSSLPEFVTGTNIENNGVKVLYFDHKLYLYFLKDTRIVSVDFNKQTYNNIVDLDDSPWRYITIDTSSWDYGKSYETDIIFNKNGDNNLGTTSISNFTTVQKISKIQGGNYSFNIGTTNFKPFTYTNGVNYFVITNYFDNYKDSLAKYGLSMDSIIAIKGTNKITKNYTLRDYIDENPDTISLPYYYDDLYGMFFEPNKYGQSTKQVNLTIKNIFGNDFYFVSSSAETASLTANVLVDYKELPEIQNFVLSSDSIVSSKGYLKENSKLEMISAFSSYNDIKEIIITPLRTYENEIIRGEPYKITDFILSEDSPEYATHNSPKKYICGIEGAKKKIVTLGPVSKDYSVNFEVQIKTSVGTYDKDKISNYPTFSSYNVKRHLAPSLSISKAKYTKAKVMVDNEEKEKTFINFTFGKNNEDLGLDTGLLNKTNEIKLYYRTSNGTYGDESIGISQSNIWNLGESLSFEYNMGNAPVGYIKIQISTTLKDAQGNYATNYEFTTAEIPVYNISPTVAYRKNHLGINTNNFSAGVGEEGTANGVLYISDTEDGRRYIIFNTSSDTIRSVDIVTGEMDGFVLEGGTW